RGIRAAARRRRARRAGARAGRAGREGASEPGAQRDEERTAAELFRVLAHDHASLRPVRSRKRFRRPAAEFLISRTGNCYTVVAGVQKERGSPSLHSLLGGIDHAAVGAGWLRSFCALASIGSLTVKTVRPGS